MFGRVEYVLQAAPGQGIVSSAVLQSDDLDEIDWEIIGGDGSQVQTNYFGKGNTQTYDREITYPAANNNQQFHSYTIDWTQDHVEWIIDGATVRTLTPATADPDQYPQTPMMIKVGCWAGGDSSNSPGTICMFISILLLSSTSLLPTPPLLWKCPKLTEKLFFSAWAGGPTNYNDGPFNMYVKSISVTDYSTGTKYEYTDESGTWQSIEAVGGEVNGNSGAAPPPGTTATAAGTTVSSTNQPVPFTSTHESKSSVSTATTGDFLPTSSSILTNSAPSGHTSTGTHTSAVSVSKIPFFWSLLIISLTSAYIFL